MSAATDVGVYVTAVTVHEVFADDTYQRPLDAPRARKIAAAWDRRLAGILEVSDRGEHADPRYAVIDGQHRWAAAALLDIPPMLVANVHSGLTVAEEAALFDKLNRQRRQTGTWDHWRARRVAGDTKVLAIEAVVAKNGLIIEPGPVDGHIGCTSALEKVVKLGDTALLDETLRLITDIWSDRRDGLDSPVINGLALVLHYLAEPIDLERLADALLEIMPRQLKTQALALREITTGTLPTLIAIAAMSLYNKKPGRKILVSSRTFGGGSINARSVRQAVSA